MKTTCTLLLTCIVSISLLQSCSRSAGLSITKRHYRNGYHIEYVSGRNAEKATKTVQPISTSIVADKIQPQPENENRTVASAETNTVSSSPYAAQLREKLGETNTAAATNTVSKQTQQAQRHLAAPIIAFEKKQITHSKALHKLAPAVARHSDDDALSLFWIVILVLILLWAFGYAGGGWGLGWAINVLLVIALILLILWLLRLI